MTHGSSVFWTLSEVGRDPDRAAAFMVVWQRGDEISPVKAAAGREAAPAEPLAKATDRANNLAVFARSGAGMLLDADANECATSARAHERTSGEE